ncbi:MAG: hypothetical protein J6U03_01005 [Muribaculaceae bacterium]|nr:hypothetical protein [Muribaculaceae bacterium]
MTFRNKIIAAIATAVITIAATSCSGKPEVLEFVPSTATTVVSVDLERFLTEAGCTFNDEGITLSDDLREALDSAENSSTKAQINALLHIKGLDLKTATYFEQKDIEGGLIVIVADDEDKVVESLSDKVLNLEKGEDDGFVTFTNLPERTATIAIDDNRCWLAGLNPDGAISLIKKARRAAKKESIASIGWKADVLSKKAALNAIVDVGDKFYDIFGDEAYRTAFAGITSGEGDSVLDIKAHIVNADGDKLDILPSLGTIDPDFLHFFSSHHNTVIAFAIADDFNWDNMLKSEGKSMASADKIFLSTMEEHLRNIDGTVAVGLNIDLDNLSPEKLDFCVAAKMKQGGADGVINKIREMAADVKQTLTERDGFLFLPMEERTLRIGKADNYLVLTTDAGVSAEPCTINADTFKGKSAVIAASGIHVNPTLDFVISATTDEASLDLSIDKTRQGALAKLIKIIIKESKNQSDALQSLLKRGDDDFSEDNYDNLIEF